MHNTAVMVALYANKLVSLKYRAIIGDLALELDREAFNWRVVDTHDESGKVFTVLFTIKMGGGTEATIKVAASMDDRVIELGPVTARWKDPGNFMDSELSYLKDLQTMVRRVMEFNDMDELGTLSV